MDRPQRLTAATALGAISLGIVLMPSVASADTAPSTCDSARASLAAASQRVTADQHALRALLHANGRHKGNRAAIRAARAALRADQMVRHQDQLAEDSDCAPGQTSDSTEATLTQVGTLLHAMSVAGTTSSNAAGPIEGAQVVAYLNGLFPGLTSALSSSQMEALLHGFETTAPTDPAALQSLIASIPGLGTVDPTQLTDPATLLTLVQSLATELSSLLGTPVAPTTDPVTAIQSFLTAVLAQVQGALGSGTDAGSLSGLTSLLSGLGLRAASL